jgi:hypothetical protein
LVSVDTVQSKNNRNERPDVSKYLILIYSTESMEALAGGAPVSPEHLEFMDRNKTSLLGGAALDSTTNATSLRDDGAGSFLITDGPFAESKEALAGYYLIEAADLDRALEMAKQIPAPGGGVEIRPVLIAS